MIRGSGYHIGKELRAMFPEQTKSIPVLIVWTIILLLIVALGLFRVETFIYNKIVSLFR